MTDVTTVTGRGLAAFLRGLLPETRQFDAQIADIEVEAVDAFIRDELPALLDQALRDDGFGSVRQNMDLGNIGRAVRQVAAKITEARA